MLWGNIYFTTNYNPINRKATCCHLHFGFHWKIQIKYLSYFQVDHPKYVTHSNKDIVSHLNPDLEILGLDSRLNIAFCRGCICSQYCCYLGAVFWATTENTDWGKMRQSQICVKIFLGLAVLPLLDRGYWLPIDYQGKSVTYILFISLCQLCIEASSCLYWVKYAKLRLVFCFIIHTYPLNLAWHISPLLHFYLAFVFVEWFLNLCS